MSTLAEILDEWFATADPAKGYPQTSKESRGDLMTRTTLTADHSRVRPVAGSASGMIRCGFCISGACSQCPGGLEHKGGLIWKCGCTKHPLVIRCLDCGNRNPEEINPDKYRCIDKQDCKDRASKRLNDNPVVQKIREITGMSETETEAKAAKKPVKRNVQTSYCLHCQEPTKGGKFVPGHDAQWVAKLVRDVMAGLTTEAKVAAHLRQVASDALAAKFTKSLGLARAKAEKEKLAAEQIAQAEAAADEAASLDAPDSDEDGIEDELEEDGDFDIEDEDVEDEPEPEPVKAAPARRSLRKAAPAKTETPAPKPAVRRRPAAK